MAVSLSTEHSSATIFILKWLSDLGTSRTTRDGEVATANAYELLGSSLLCVEGFKPWA
jgi:hypothetical protein